MKKTLVIVLALFGLCLPVRAESPCRKQPIQDLAKAIAGAYEGKTLASLDAQKPYLGKVRIVIEHSLAEDNAKDRFVIKWFNSLAGPKVGSRAASMKRCPVESPDPW